MSHYDLKTVSEIHDHLMQMESGDMGFDCRDACLALCEQIEQLQTTVEGLRDRHDRAIEILSRRIDQTNT